jgi:hypothetical protein
MVTTNRFVSLDAVGHDGTDLIHLTGSVQIVAHASMGQLVGFPVQVDLRVDAARVRGVGLKTGMRYWAQGVDQSRHQLGEFSGPLELVSGFELLGCAPDQPLTTRMTLTVRFKVTVPADGRVTVALEEVKLLPDSSSRRST